MRPFIVTIEIREQLQQLADHAQKNPFTMDDLLDLKNGQAKPAGDYSEFTRHLPFGYRLVFSIEQQVKGDVRHLSMSVDSDGRIPSMAVVEECMDMLGFRNKRVEDCIVHMENISPRRQAINVLEFVNAPEIEPVSQTETEN